MATRMQETPSQLQVRATDKLKRLTRQQDAMAFANLRNHIFSLANAREDVKALAMGISWERFVPDYVPEDPNAIDAEVADLLAGIVNAAADDLRKLLARLDAGTEAQAAA